MLDGVVTVWHELKTDPSVFDDVVAFRKTHEIRLNDRNFKVGDGLILKKTTYSGTEIKAGLPLNYTGDEFRCVITHVLSGYGLIDGWVILSILPLEIKIKAIIKDLEDKINHYESLRPIWATGYSSDSIAAQCNADALSSLWALLGVCNQTDAVKKIKALAKNIA